MRHLFRELQYIRLKRSISRPGFDVAIEIYWKLQTKIQHLKQKNERQNNKPHKHLN